MKVVLTKEKIEALQTGNGGYSKKLLSFLGVQWPPQKGWKRKVIGREVDQSDYELWKNLATKKTQALNKNFYQNDPKLF